MRRLLRTLPGQRGLDRARAHHHAVGMAIDPKPCEIWTRATGLCKREPDRERRHAERQHRRARLRAAQMGRS